MKKMIKKVIDDRIGDLEYRRINLINEATKKLTYGGWEPDVDFAELALDLDDIYSRKDELKKLEEKLGLIPVEKTDESKIA